MSRAWLVLAVAALLAACGVDGPPQALAPEERPGVTVGGDLRLGVGGRI
ncbi:argininosuccinate lyase [Alkalilacustris brevis]|nr:argininosuccinate lyase [Alkalilacustris brevis]